MQRLDCHVKEYAWGKCGEHSEVARLFSAGHQNFTIGTKTPYAELWMGTHPDGPAKIRGVQECLLSHAIARASESDLTNYFLENSESRKKEIHLPFIMKIMSIKHTLSLQVHPTKAQAEILHREDPLHYPDRNHKPELAYALTRFELLCGFRPAEQIVENMKAFPELRKVMGEKNTEKFICCFHTLVSIGKPPSESIELETHLRICFSSMLSLQVERPAFVEEQLHNLFTRIDANVRGCLIEDTVAVMKDTYRRFPKDIGCFAPLYVNHMILQPGECCYYAAKELHAYLSGECVECVSCSNNTIRAALTPKFIDRKNLVEVLNYHMTDPEYYIVKPRPLEYEPRIAEFAPIDCADFTLHEIQVLSTTTTKIKDQTITIPALNCPSIIVIVEGKAFCQEISSDTASTASDSEIVQSDVSILKRGDIFYIAPRQSIWLEINGQSGRFLAFRTFSYETGPDHASRIVVKQPVNFSASNVNVTSNYNASNNENGRKLNTTTMRNKIAPEITSLKLAKKTISFFNAENEMDGFV